MKERTKRYFGSVRRFGKYDGKLKISLMFFAKIALLPEFFAKFEGMHAKTVCIVIFVSYAFLPPNIQSFDLYVRLG